MEKDIQYKQAQINAIKKEEHTFIAGLTEPCPTCNETKIEDYDYHNRKKECLTCRGYGQIGPIECICGNVITTKMLYLRRQGTPNCPWCGEKLRICLI